LVVAVLAVAALAAVVLLPIGSLVSELAQSARAAGAAGVALFVLAYVVSTIAFLPGSLLTLAAGFAYGPVWGLLIASPASVAGATAAFLLGRSVLAEWAAARVGSSERMRSLQEAIAREGFVLVLLLRLSPVIPFNALNYALSLTRVRLGTYVLASFLGMLPATALYVYLGSLAPAAADLSASAGAGGSARTILYLAGLAATVAVAVIVARLARRAIARKMA
jgi:uncharacterized membrane protein YdjX (TVP38/TMEM64 family)